VNRQHTLVLIELARNGVILETLISVYQANEPLGATIRVLHEQLGVEL